MDKNKWLGLLFFGLAIGRVIWPDSNIDLTNIILIIIAIILFFPELLSHILPFIKKIKIGGVEIELEELIKKIGIEVERAQESMAKEQITAPSEIINEEINKILIETSKDPRAAFLLLATRIEQQVRERVRKSEIYQRNRFMPISKMVQLGVEDGIFSKDVLTAFRDFWVIRNRVAHGEAFEVDDSVIYSLISLGTEILKMISTEKGNQ